MSFHLLAYRDASVPTGTSVYTALPAISDPVFDTVNSKFFAPNELNLVAAFAISGSLDRARVSSSRLKRIARPQLRPISVNTSIPTDPNLVELVDEPIVLAARAEFGVEAIHNGGGAEDVRAFLWVSDGLDPAPEGEVITLRATTVTTATAFQWSEVSLTWDEELPQGQWALVGSELIAGDSLAHRWILPSTRMRPGALSTASAANRQPPYFANGRLGEWGRFDARTMPRLEVFDVDTPAPDEIYAQIVRVG